ncbi:hypothetical protein IKG16_01365 [Candidatus Saccharibacteria bacterium]|nr:hypothetical protein [Candidatus Saccharibacteria bacterium]
MILITNPEVDALTRYLSVWSEKLKKECKNIQGIFHLKGKRVNRRQIESILVKKSVKVILLNGHGSDKSIYGDNYEALIDKDNVELLFNKVAHALSCNTAKTLGPLAMKKGAKGYVGYDEKFVAFLQEDKISNPLKDDTAALFLNPAFIAPKALINGKTPEEAVRLAKNEYNRSIRKALTSDIQSDNDQFVSWLMWDRNHLKSC